MQNFRNLPALPKKTKKKRLVTVKTSKVDEVILSDFAALADRLGFQSDQISALKERSSDGEIACAALLKARKPDRYKNTDGAFESHIEQIVEVFATATRLIVEAACPDFVSDDPAAPGVRCGFPGEEAQTRDAPSLSIGNLHVKVDEQGESIKSFFVRQSVYFELLVGKDKLGPRGPSHLSPQDSGGGDVISWLVQESRLNLDTREDLHGDLERATQVRIEQERIERERME